MMSLTRGLVDTISAVDYAVTHLGQHVAGPVKTSAISQCYVTLVKLYKSTIVLVIVYDTSV